MRVERRRDLRSCTSNWRQEPASPDEQFERLLKRLMVANAAERAGRNAVSPVGVDSATHRPETATAAGRVAVGAGSARHRLPHC